MKNYITLSIFLLLIYGCATSFETRLDKYNELIASHKAMSIAVYSTGQPTGAWGIGLGQSLEEARENAINTCKSYKSSNSVCLLEIEDNYNVFEKSFNSYQQYVARLERERYEAFVQEKKQLCISYGYVNENSIAACVQKEISDEKDRLLAQQAQAERIRAQAYAEAEAQRRKGMDALGNYGRCLQNEGNLSACNNAWQGYTPNQNQICNFKSWEGLIVSGDCRRSNITIGGTTYKRM